MKIGVSTNCECGNTLYENLKAIKEAGFDCVMLSEKDSELSLEESIKLVHSTGLKVAFVHLTYGNDSNQLWTSTDDNNQLVNRICKSIKILSNNGIDTAVMHPSAYGLLATKPPMGRTEETGIANMKKILQEAKRYKVKIAVENLNNSLENKDLEVLLDNIDNEYLGFCYDVGHHYLLNPQDNFFKKYNNRVFAIHLHNNEMTSANFIALGVHPDLHLLPFDGKIDMTKTIKQIAKSSYNGPILLELHRTNFLLNPPSALSVQARYKNLTAVEYLKEANKQAKVLEQIYLGEKHGK